MNKKNKSDWIEGKSWHRIRNEMLLSPAFRALSPMALKILFAILSELGRHSGKDNGHLIFTNRNFIAYGIYRDAIKPGLLELEGVGFIAFTRGRAGMKGYGVARRYRLTFLPILDPDGNEAEPPTDEWTSFTTTEEAEMAAKAARRNKRNSNFRSGIRTTSVVVRKPDHLTNRRNQNVSPQVIENIESTGRDSGPLSTSVLSTPPPVVQATPSPPSPPVWATPKLTPVWIGQSAPGRYDMAMGAMSEHCLPFADEV